MIFQLGAIYIYLKNEKNKYYITALNGYDSYAGGAVIYI